MAELTVETAMVAADLVTNALQFVEEATSLRWDTRETINYGHGFSATEKHREPITFRTTRWKA